MTTKRANPERRGLDIDIRERAIDLIITIQDPDAASSIPTGTHLATLEQIIADAASRLASEEPPGGDNKWVAIRGSSTDATLFLWSGRSWYPLIVGKDAELLQADAQALANAFAFLQGRIDSLAARVAAQSALLSEKAEKPVKKGLKVKTTP